ncbi:MAG TPA: hypothetical protein VHY22_13085 [Chthoniobacteraceae bacterium]|nr:hypothetical protein [Chthoniobacteraceae bacterium]
MAEERRYFPGDDPELRALLDRYLDGLGERLGRSTFAADVAFLLLAGGYGRGEGGVYAGGEKPALYNDLEFYLVLKNGAAAGAAQAWCAGESHAGEEETGIEVEFKLLTLGALMTAGPSMFYYDLLAAHRLVFGDAGIVGALPARLRDAGQIPLHEATRLLFNRGSGLFYSRVLLDGGEIDTAFIERNHAKARLAFADAVLAVNGLYHWSCAERNARLRRPLQRIPGNFRQLDAWHAGAVEFKLHPRHESPQAGVLMQRQRELAAAWTELFLWVESLRLGAEFRNARDYAVRGERLYPELPVMKNIALHLRDRLQRGVSGGAMLDYPRAPLQRALALLMQEPVEMTLVRKFLPGVASLPEAREAYRRRWQFYN